MEKEKNKIKAIIFDCWDTLFTSEPKTNEIHPFSKFAEKTGIIGILIDRKNKYTDNYNRITSLDKLNKFLK